MTRKLRDACWGRAALSLQGLALFSALLALPSATLRAVSGTVEPEREAQPLTHARMPSGSSVVVVGSSGFCYYVSV